MKSRDSNGWKVKKDCEHNASRAFADTSPLIGTSDCSVPNNLLTELVNWIGLNTEYDISVAPRIPPTIAQCKAGDIIFYEGDEVLVESTLRAA